MRLRSEIGRPVAGVWLFCAFVMACGTTVLGASLPATAEPADSAEAVNVESSIVRAIIATESAFNPAARSHAGAIGLMQLMPMTARELGVNPHIPEENIEGGTRYFAQLLRTFGRLDLALIAYNGGPGFAERYLRGQTALYGETRDYVRKVMDRLQRTQP